MEVFLEHGYERASLQQIASRAGVSTATLFKRFPTKASLFEAIVVTFWKADAEPGEPLEAKDPWAGLRGIGGQFARLLRQPKLAAFYRVLIAEAQRFPELSRLLLERGKLPYVNRVSEYVKIEMDAGNLKTADPMRAARQFLAMISDQLFWPSMLDPGFSASDQDARKAVEEAILTFMARYGTAENQPGPRRTARSATLRKSR